jgi:hypothetical protein
LTKDGALSSTAEMFFHNLKENISFPALLALLASASELKLILSAGSKGSKKVKRAKQTQTEALEKRIKGECERLGLGDVLSAGWEGGNGKGVVLPNPSNRRAVSLLWSHLLRVDDLESELLEGEPYHLLEMQDCLADLTFNRAPQDSSAGSQSYAISHQRSCCLSLARHHHCMHEHVRSTRPSCAFYRFPDHAIAKR